MTVVAADPIFSVLHLTNQLTSFASQNSRCYSNFDADVWVMRWKKLTCRNGHGCCCKAFKLQNKNWYVLQKVHIF